jgi:hypothetical protein
MPADFLLRCRSSVAVTKILRMSLRERLEEPGKNLVVRGGLPDRPEALRPRCTRRTDREGGSAPRRNITYPRRDVFLVSPPSIPRLRHHEHIRGDGRQSRISARTRSRSRPGRPGGLADGEDLEEGPAAQIARQGEHLKGRAISRTSMSRNRRFQMCAFFPPLLRRVPSPGRPSGMSVPRGVGGVERKRRSVPVCPENEGLGGKAGASA